MTGPFAADCHVDGDVPCAVGVGCAGPVVLGVGVGVVGGTVEQERELHSGRHRFDLDCPGVPSGGGGGCFEGDGAPGDVVAAVEVEGACSAAGDLGVDVLDAVDLGNPGRVAVAAPQERKS